MNARSLKAIYFLFAGGLVYANLLGKDFIIINSVQVARDLLERRSSIYSERPYIPANELWVTLY